MNNKITLEYTPNESIFYLNAPFEYKDTIKKIGGKWNQSRKSWGFPVDLNIWNEIKTTFGGKGELFVSRRFLEEISRVEKRQNDFFAFKKQAEENDEIDFSVDGVELNGKNPLFNYQKWGVKAILHCGDGFLIGDTPGCGKTIQALASAIERRRLGEISNCLIVCLASLKYNWLDEISKFTKEKALVIDGSPASRKQKWMATGYFFKIANYETIVNDLFIDNSPRSKQHLTSEETAFRKYMQSQFDMIAVDEIHAIKHHTSMRAKALKQLKAKFRLGLSGTPIDGRLEELHSIYEFLKPGLFESKSVFMNNHAIMDMFGAIKGYIDVQKVRNKILPYYLRRTKEKVLKDLPAKLFKDVYVELDSPERKIYKELIDGSHEITSEEQAATRILRVRQFLDFPELLDMRNKSSKFLALAELLEELVDENGEKVIIFTQYREVLDLIVMNLRSRYKLLQIHGDVDSKERVEIVKKFNENSNYKVLIGTDAMSTGLNIGGANAVIHYEDNFSPALMQQRNDRAHRATTRHNVTVYRFICKGTIEEKVRKKLGDKMEVNNQVLDEDCKEFGINSLNNLDLLKLL